MILFHPALWAIWQQTKLGTPRKLPETAQYSRLQNALLCWDSEEVLSGGFMGFGWISLGFQ